MKVQWGWTFIKQMPIDKKQFAIKKCIYEDIYFLTSSTVPFPVSYNTYTCGTRSSQTCATAAAMWAELVSVRNAIGTVYGFTCVYFSVCHEVQKKKLLKIIKTTFGVKFLYLHRAACSKLWELLHGKNTDISVRWYNPPKKFTSATVYFTESASRGGWGLWKQEAYYFKGGGGLFSLIWNWVTAKASPRCRQLLRSQAVLGRGAASTSAPHCPQSSPALTTAGMLVMHSKHYGDVNHRTASPAD